MADNKKLYMALAKAQASLGAIGKDGDGQRGEYVSVDAAVAASKAAMAMHDLALFQTSIKLEEMITSGETTVERRLVLRRESVLVHTPSGESMDLSQVWPVNMHGTRVKSIDHNVAAADSFGLTYLLRGLLLFARGDEHDTSDQPRPSEEYRHADRDEYGAKTYDSKAQKVIEVEAKVTPAPVMNYAEMLLTGKLTKDTCALIQSGHQPMDVDAETLNRLNWFLSPSAEDLESMGFGLVPDPVKKDLWKSAVSLVGADTVKKIWGALVPTGSNPTGYQARVIACLCMINKD